MNFGRTTANGELSIVNKTGQHSIEILHHFRCGFCGKWWSIGAPIRQNCLVLPWCGQKQTIAQQTSKTRPIHPHRLEMSEADTPTIPVGSRWERAILHLDMDAFFVNVHLLDHPQNRGKPLAIGGRPDQRGVVSSASYEARQFGVRSAMPMSQALRLCPELIIASVDWEQVRAGSRTVMSILHEYGPVEPMSVDEAYVDLSERLNPKIIAVQIRNRVKGADGLRAPSGWLPINWLPKLHRFR